MISIITTVRNGSQYLPEYFEGLASQTLKNFEICIHNDGSTDNTADIIEHYSEQLSSKGIQVRYSFESKSKGVGYGKNAAVKLASGRFLCFNDADDVSLPKRLELQLAACLNAPDPDHCFVGSKFERLPANSTKRYTEWANSLTNEQLYNQVYTIFGPSLIAPVWFLSRALYDKVGPFKQDVPVGYPEDLDFFYRALRLHPTLIKVDQPLVVYRYHPSCATLSVCEETIWKLRIEHLEHSLLNHINSFSVWDLGTKGRKFFKSLSAENRKKIANYCGSKTKSLRAGFFEVFDDESGSLLAKIPAKSPGECQKPVLVFEKMEFIKGFCQRIFFCPQKSLK